MAALEMYTAKLIEWATISNGTIVNYSHHGNLHVDITIAVAPEVNIALARKVAMEAMHANPYVLAEPAPSVNVQNEEV